MLFFFLFFVNRIARSIILTEFSMQFHSLLKFLFFWNVSLFSFVYVRQYYDIYCCTMKTKQLWKRTTQKNRQHAKYYLCQSWGFLFNLCFVPFFFLLFQTILLMLSEVFIRYDIFFSLYSPTAFPFLRFYCIKFVLSGAWGWLSCWYKLVRNLFDFFFLSHFHLHASKKRYI